MVIQNQHISLPNKSYNRIYQNFSLLNQTHQPVISGYTNTNGGYENVFVQGNYAYVCGNGGDSTGIIGITLSIFDIRDKSNPVLISYLTTGSVPWVSGSPYYLNGAYNIAVNDNYLYVASAGSSYLYVVDISNPYTPKNIGRLLISNTPGSIYGVAYKGGYCYLATQNQGLTVVDVGGGLSGGSPAAPIQTFQEGGAVKSFGVAVFNDTVFTTQYSTASPYTIRQIKSWALSNTGSFTTPKLLQSLQVISLGEALGITVTDNTAFVTVQATGAYNIDLIDITNPSAMSNLSQINSTNSFNSGFTAQYSRKVLYIPSGSNSTYGGAIDAYDITNRLSPIHLSQVTTKVAHSVFGGIVVSDGYIYCGDYGVSPSYNGSLDIFTEYNNSFSRIYSHE